MDKKIAAAHKRRSLCVGNFTDKEWAEVKAKFSNTCLRCNKREPRIVLTADHVIPLSLGGSNTIDNIQPLCKSCNSVKRCDTTDYRIDFYRNYLVSPLA